MTRILAAVLSLLVLTVALPAHGETQAIQQARMKNRLHLSGMDWGSAVYVFNGLANAHYYDTSVELLAASPSDGRIGYAIDTDTAYMMVAGSWVALASAGGLLGTNGGTIGNETNNVWTFTENSENLTLTYASDLVTFASGTSATFAFTPASAFAGDVTLNGGAGALTFDAASSSIVTTDDSSTGLLVGSAGMLGLLTIDTTDNFEEVNVVGTTATSSFRVDTGFATFDEQAVLSAGADVNDDVLLGGGAGALTFDAASSSIVTTDDSATGLVVGSAGSLSVLTLDTQNAAEGLTVDGYHTTTGISGVVTQTITIPFTDFRVFDNTAALLPVAGATDDLGHVNGTLGTNAPSLQTEDLKAEGGNPTLNRAYFEWEVPASYVTGSTVTLRMHAGALTTVSDDTMTLDAECWVADYANDDGTVSSDLVAEAAQDIKNLTLADIDFTIDDDATDHELVAGSLVQCQITTRVSDGATGTAVIAIIRRVQILLST
jgi:hypothetical protein